ncbi:hypothetical protein JRO89_XS11G0201100 [Xanthoceras sorbifolium]|uniref:PPPDE domain-containing protein n=1 Tax=Xanthoceras sorbifolium TaxID=99658 RepID=A0ABQ8HGD4_9ROSI|nr:hypothetical protein JRO89_XS11G0201100 [Xanthoceras sorbifolium]
MDVCFWGSIVWNIKLWRWKDHPTPTGLCIWSAINEFAFVVVSAIPVWMIAEAATAMDVILHIYDVTNSGSDKTNNTIMQINKIFKDGIGIGGIFHSAVQVLSLSISLVFKEKEKLTFVLRTLYMERKNGLLVFVNRDLEFLVAHLVNQILRELSREWPGSSYDLLSRNCNHFCDELCERLGVPKLPGWVNRFANAGDAAMEVAGNTALRFKQAKTEIVSASKVAYRFLLGVTTNANGANGVPDSPSNSNRGSPRFQATWFKNLVTTGAKPSSSSEIEDREEDALATTAARSRRSASATEFTT